MNFAPSLPHTQSQKLLKQSTPFTFPLIYAVSLHIKDIPPVSQSLGLPSKYFACTWNGINYTFTHLPPGYGYSPAIDAKVAQATLAEISPSHDVSHHQHLADFPSTYRWESYTGYDSKFQPSKNTRTFYVSVKNQRSAQNVKCWGSF